MLVAGVDEAGRGPVIGPMVMAIAVIEEKDLVLLQTMGVKDSKLLTHQKRYEIFNLLQEVCKIEYTVVSPKEIDAAVLSHSDNLNWLEARVAAKLIDKINCAKVILDCPSINLETYGNYIKNKVKGEKTKKPKIIVEHKADLNYLIVGAASIVAKVKRDEEIEKIRVKIKKEIGSGYSSDPITQKFVEENWNKKYDFFRKSWDTWKKHKSKFAQKSLGEY